MKMKKKKKRKRGVMRLCASNIIKGLKESNMSNVLKR